MPDALAGSTAVVDESQRPRTAQRRSASRRGPATWPHPPAADTCHVQREVRSEAQSNDLQVLDNTCTVFRSMYRSKSEKGTPIDQIPKMKDVSKPKRLSTISQNNVFTCVCMVHVFFTHPHCSTLGALAIELSSRLLAFLNTLFEECRSDVTTASRSASSAEATRFLQTHGDYTPEERIAFLSRDSSINDLLFALLRYSFKNV